MSGVDYTNPANYHLSQYFDQWDRDHSTQYAVKSDVLVRLRSAFLIRLSSASATPTAT